MRWVIHGQKPHVTTSHVRHPTRNLVPNARGDEVDYVVVNGQVIVEHGCVLTVDAEAILTNAQRLADSIGSKAEPEFWRLNTLNAQLMRSDQL